MEKFPQGLPPDVIEAIATGAVRINGRFSTGLATDMLAKLTWNLKGIVDPSKSGSKLDKSWALMDFIVTSSSLPDWCFYTLGQSRLDEIADRCDRKRFADATKFTDFICENASEIAACRHIANTLKHHTRRKEDETVYSWIENEKDGVKTDGDADDWNPKIFYDGKVVDSIPFADSVTSTWSRIFLGLGLIPEHMIKQIRKMNGLAD